jgi:cyclopropane fatty-acyl-phospholipid synthase-like methyltransferase
MRRLLSTFTLIVFVLLAIDAWAQHKPQGEPHGQGHLQHRFEDAEEWAKRFDDPAREAWQMPARVLEALEIKPGQAVADIGAGTGYFTIRLARLPAKPKVYAVDIEPSMLQYLQKRAAHEGLTNVTTVLAGPDRTNLPEPVDLVLIVDTYHHIPNRVAYFNALRKTLKPGGRVAIVDFRKDSPEGPPPEFRFTPEQITGEMTQAGFQLQRTHDFLPRQIFLVYASGDRP